MPRTSLLLVVYGLFLVAGALTAISISGWDRSKTALFSSGGAAMLVWFTAWLATRPKQSARARSVGIGLGLLFAATFFWRLTENWKKPLEEAWRAANPGTELITSQIQSPLQNWLFPVFIAGSLLTTLLLALPERRGSGETVAQN